MRRRFVLCVLLVVALASPAAADVKLVGDRSDVRGPLDIKWVRQSHDTAGKIRYGISTFENYSERDLRYGRFVFRFDIDDDAGYERFVTVHWRDFEKTDGGKLASPLKNAKREIIGRVGSTHWNGNRLRIWLARRHLEHPTDYEVSISSEWRRGACEERTCIDRMPTIAHHLWPLCFGRDPEIVGTDGNDVIQGTPRDDVIFGAGGHDRIETNGGWDRVCGGTGNDHIIGSKRPDTFDGGEGNDRLAGRGATFRCVENTPGDDHVDCAFPLNELHGGAGADELLGGPHTDWLRGGADRDTLYGRDGGDRLRGGEGYDVLDGGRGDDECRQGEVKQRC